MTEKEEERCCGACCWFKFEDISGWGQCPFEDITGIMNCSDLCITGKFVSLQEKRHHLAMLRKCQRCMRLSDNKDMNVIDICNSIDFVVEYAKRL